MTNFDEELISGSGSGGKGRRRNPENAEDNLNSKADARILDLISEGSIAGFATPLEKGFTFGSSNYGLEGQKDIFFNKTPLRKLEAPVTDTTQAANNFNMEGVEIETKNGDDPQEVIKGFSKVRTVVSAFPNDDLQDALASRTLTFSDTHANRVDEVIVNIGIPSLFAAFNNGDVRGLTLRFRIFRSIDGGTEVMVVNKLLDGRTNDLYELQFPVDIPAASNTNDRTIAIKVDKFNALHDDPNIIQQGNSIRFMSIVKVINDKISYDNSALVGIKVGAEEFGSVPSRTYLIKGIKCRIPSGTSVDIETGRIIYPTDYVFNGSMQAAEFCACPVMVLYDLLTNKRYGLGEQVLTPAEKATFNGTAKNIDVFSFVEASQYANTLISDRRNNPASLTGTYVQSGTTITMKFVNGTGNNIIPKEMGLQKNDKITCQFTSGGASNFTTKITAANKKAGIIKVQASNSGSFNGDVTITKGTTESRFSFNGVINRKSDAFKLLNKVASVFRGSLYYSEGKIKLICDKPEDPVYLFNRSNVTAEGFSYEGSDVKTRSNCVVVRFFNNVTQQIDYVQHPPTLTQVTDDPFVKAYGLNKKQIDAFGCTSGGQASRLARFIYYSENFLTETCTFTMTSEAGVMLEVGMVISISDPVRSGTRLAGRITAASTSEITVDSISGISFSSGDKLSVILGNGNMETKDVSGISGSVITVSPAFTSAPNVNSVWLYEKTTAKPTTWRVLNIEQSQNLQYSVTAVSYDESIYNTIEGGADVEAKDITNLDEILDAPTNLNISESLYKHVPSKQQFDTNDGNIRIQLRVNFDGVKGAVKYKIVYRKGTANNNSATFKAANNFGSSVFFDNPVDVITRRTEFELRDVDAGDIYEFTVQSINAGGLLSQATTPVTKTVEGKTAPPSSINNSDFTVDVDPNAGITFNWTPIVPSVSNGFADLDIAGYEIRKKNPSDSSFSAATHPETGASNKGIKVQSNSLFLPVEFAKTTATYLLKAYDTSLIFANTAAERLVTINTPTAIQNATTTSENGLIKIRWEAPATNTYKIKNYKITFNDGSVKTIFADSTEFQTPAAWTSGSRTFAIKAVDIAGNEGESTDVVVAIPEPAAPDNLTHSFTTDSVVLKWEEDDNPPSLQPPVIGYRIYRNGGTDGIAQIKGTEFTLLVNNTNFPNLSASYQVAAVYADPAFPTDGRASTNQATRTISISVASAPSPSFSFELDFAIVKWNEVNGSLPTLRYGIFDDQGSLITEADSTEFRLKANFDTKTIQIKALSAAYINAVGDPTAQALFIGAGSDFLITRQNLIAPTNGSFKLGSEGGLGFVTSSWTPPIVTSANNLDLKDFKIIRSSFDTLSEALSNFNSTNDLLVIQDTESFKEEVSWKLASDSTDNSITRYYYVIPRDLLNNEGTALRIEVEIFRPLQVPESGTCEVIDNNVLLRWGEPSVNETNQLKIDHYEIRKHTGSGASSQVWSTSLPIGKGAASDDKKTTTTTSRFSVIFETVADTYTYLIKAYDTAGNETKDDQIFFKSLSVSQPPDFVLNADYDSVFSTSGTGLTSPQEIDSVAFTNCLKIFDSVLNKNILYLPVLTNSSGVGTQTWEEHFIGTGSSSNPQFANISAIQSAGFSAYLEPAPTGDSGKGEYQEVFDFGTNLASSKVSTLAEFANQGSGTVNQSQRLDLASLGSGGTFSDGTESLSNSAQRFGTAFQRVRYKTRAISVAGSLTRITNLNLTIDVKIKNDTGIGTASASDSGGTQVNFNVSFVDVQGIAVTPNTISSTNIADKKVIAVVDFVDAPNPTGFKVFLFNISGTRVSGAFTWQCRGT